MYEDVPRNRGVGKVGDAPASRPWRPSTWQLMRVLRWEDCCEEKCPRGVHGETDERPGATQPREVVATYHEVGVRLTSSHLKVGTQVMNYSDCSPYCFGLLWLSTLPLKKAEYEVLQLIFPLGSTWNFSDWVAQLLDSECEKFD